MSGVTPIDPALFGAITADATDLVPATLVIHGETIKVSSTDLIINRDDTDVGILGMVDASVIIVNSRFPAQGIDLEDKATLNGVRVKVKDKTPSQDGATTIVTFLADRSTP